MSGLYRKHETAGEITKKSVKNVKYSVSLCCFERHFALSLPHYWTLSTVRSEL